MFKNLTFVFLLKAKVYSTYILCFLVFPLFLSQAHLDLVWVLWENPIQKNKKNERVGSYSKSIPGPFPNTQPSGPVHPPLLNHTRPYAFNMRWVLYQVGPYKDKGLFPTILVWWLWKSRAGLSKNGSLQKKYEGGPQISPPPMNE